jgi:hypothetical protein
MLRVDFLFITIRPVFLYGNLVLCSVAKEVSGGDGVSLILDDMRETYEGDCGCL